MKWIPKRSYASRSDQLAAGQTLDTDGTVGWLPGTRTLIRSRFGDSPNPGLYRAWPTQDGHVAIVIIENRQFEAVMRVLGLEAVISDPRFGSLVSRIMNAPALYELIAAEIGKFTNAELATRARTFEAPIATINDMRGFLADEQAVANGVLVELPDAHAGALHVLRSPPRYSQTPTDVRHGVPQLGEHTAEVLREAGFSPDEIAKLGAAA